MFWIQTSTEFVCVGVECLYLLEVTCLLCDQLVLNGIDHDCRINSIFWVADAQLNWKISLAFVMFLAAGNAVDQRCSTCAQRIVATWPTEGCRRERGSLVLAY